MGSCRGFCGCMSVVMGVWRGGKCKCWKGVCVFVHA